MEHLDMIEDQPVGDRLRSPEAVASAIAALGALPAAIAALAYWTQLPGGITLDEPFSTYSNVCYWAAGAGIYALPAITGAFAYPQLYAAGSQFILLGAGSAAFHANGSNMGSWEHAVDIFSIYMLFVTMAHVAITGLYYTVLGRAQRPRDAVPLATGVLAHMGAALVLFYWDRRREAHVPRDYFLLSSGVLAIACNSLQRWIKTGSLIELVGIAVPRAALLLGALYVNWSSKNPDPSVAEDWAHGTWHYLSSLALLTTTLAGHEGIDGLPAQEGQGIWRTRTAPFEAVARLYAVLVVTAAVGIEFWEGGEPAWRAYWATLVTVALPLWVGTGFYLSWHGP